MLGGDIDCVYASRDASGSIVSVSKHGNKLGRLTGRLADAPVSIFADDRGFIILNFVDSFYVYDPNGYPVEEGGGNHALINERNG